MTQQLLRNTGALLSQTFYAGEEPVDADGAVTVTVRTAGGVVDSTGPATSVGDGRYTYSLAPRSSLGQLAITWAGTFSGVAQTLTSTVDVVGGFYVALAEIRALPGLGDAGKYPTEDLVKARQWFETLFENHVGRAFVPRGTTERVSGSGCSSLLLSQWPVRAVTAVSIYTTATAITAYTVGELADLYAEPTGAIRRMSLGLWPWGNSNIQVTYEHGDDSPPADVRDVCLVAVREKLMEDFSGARGNRQFAVATEAGIVRSSMPGDKRPFGIPAVDAVAESYRARFHVPAMA